MAKAEYKRFEQPDERRPFPNGHAEIVNVAGGVVGRFVFYPGWRWSNDVKPIAKTESCEASRVTSRSGWTTARSSWRGRAT